MINVIPGVYNIPPCQYSTIVPKPHNFGYTNFMLPEKRAKVKLEFICYTHCRESLNVSRNFFYSEMSYGVDKFTKFEYKEKPFFYYPPLPLELFAFVLDAIENNIGVKTKAKIQLTDEDGILAIFPGRFWGGVAGRFGFLTAILRSCCKVISEEGYSKSGWGDNIQRWISRAIDADKYLSETKHSVIEFMNGKTFIKNMKMTGDWYEYMKGYGHLEDPTKFDHETYIGYVKGYAYDCWVSLRKPMGRDSEIWNTAERYAAINACR